MLTSLFPNATYLLSKRIFKKFKITSSNNQKQNIEVNFFDEKIICPLKNSRERIIPESIEIIPPKILFEMTFYPTVYQDKEMISLLKKHNKQVIA